MTVTDVRIPAPRTADHDATPESQNLARLQAMLKDPAERGNWPDIERAITYLTATSVLAA